MSQYKTGFYKTEADYDNDTYTLRRKCATCGVTHEDSVAGANLFKYRQGATVQDAFPTLSPAARELFFNSGICGLCWDSLWGR